MAWNFKQEDLNEEISTGGNYLDKSGCYKAKIVSIEEKKTTNKAEQVIFKFDVDGKEATVYHIYTKQDGTPLDFKVRHLNHLLYINKLTDPSKLKTLEGKEVGVMLKAKLSQDGKYINFDIEGFYYLPNSKTAKELKDGLSAETVAAMMKKYDVEEPLKRTTESGKTNNGKVEEVPDFNF